VKILTRINQECTLVN